MAERRKDFTRTSWTAERLALAKALYVDQGLSDSVTGVRLGVSGRAIRAVAHKRGWTRDETHWAANVGAAAVATHTGRIRPKGSGRPARERDERLPTWTGWFLEAGWRPREVAGLFGVDPSSLEAQP